VIMRLRGFAAGRVRVSLARQSPLPSLARASLRTPTCRRPPVGVPSTRSKLPVPVPTPSGGAAT